MKEIPAGWEAVIGLEIHAQLKTQSKIFCSCAAAYGGDPNTRTCPTCLGLPGALPRLSGRVLDMAVRAGMATDCRIAERSRMARKNYFYPDLPKGYQISQFEEPLCAGGHLDVVVDGTSRRIGITRIHIEEDAGKSLHGPSLTRVDLNRSGVPLIEIVSEPDLRSPGEAYEFLIRLRQILTYLEVCDGNMEEGSLRCDANASVRRIGETALGTKTEVKNLNSFRGVEAALHFEIRRQIDCLEKGGRVEALTLLWDAAARRASPMRSKEEAHDYRYFPEPDLPPLQLDGAWLTALRGELPELPAARRQRFESQYGLRPYDADILTGERDLADYFESVVAGIGDARLAANWVVGELLRHLKACGESLAEFPVQPGTLIRLLEQVKSGRISNSAAKTVMEKLVAAGGDVSEWIESLGLAQLSELGELRDIVDRVLAEHPREVERYRGGTKKLLGFFVGQVMQITGGKANPQAASRLVGEALDAGQGDAD